MSGETGTEILEVYQHISNKLKKRFLRKPNVAEASESFTTLGQQCENVDLPSYAGLCWIAAARCEGSLGNIPSETTCLIRSARQFCKAEENDFNLGCPSGTAENLQAGLGCYTHASTRLSNNCSIQIGLDLEIVEFLKKINRQEYIQGYLEQAVNLSEDRSITKLHCLELLASHFIKLGDYVGALETFKKIFKLLENLPDNGARAESLLNCEINCVFLLLILKPSPQKLTPALAKILEKYTWGDKTDKSLKDCRMSEKLFLLLQSVVTICQSLDTSGLTHLESEFWPLLDKEGKDLLRILVMLYGS